MPGVPRQELTPAGRRRLRQAQAKIERAEGELVQAPKVWAEVVRELGQAAAARELGVSPQVLNAWVRRRERGLPPAVRRKTTTK